MAYGKGVNRTIIDTITPSTIMAPGLVGGQVKCFQDTYTGTTAEAGDTLTVKMGPTLPTGAKIVDVLLEVGATGGPTVSVGDQENTVRYITTAAASSITRLATVGGNVGYIVDMTTAATPDNQVLITLSAACAAVVIRLVVTYSVE